MRHVSFALSLTRHPTNIWNSAINLNCFISSTIPCWYAEKFPGLPGVGRTHNTKVIAAVTEGFGSRPCAPRRKWGEGTGCLNAAWRGSWNCEGGGGALSLWCSRRRPLTDSCTNCGLHRWYIIHMAALIMFWQLDVLWLKTPKVKATN